MSGIKKLLVVFVIAFSFLFAGCTAEQEEAIEQAIIDANVSAGDYADDNGHSALFNEYEFDAYDVYCLFRQAVDVSNEQGYNSEGIVARGINSNECYYTIEGATDEQEEFIKDTFNTVREIVDIKFIEVNGDNFKQAKAGDSLTEIIKIKISDSDKTAKKTSWAGTSTMKFDAMNGVVEHYIWCRAGRPINGTYLHELWHTLGFRGHVTDNSEYCKTIMYPNVNSNLSSDELTDFDILCLKILYTGNWYGVKNDEQLKAEYDRIYF